MCVYVCVCVNYLGFSVYRIQSRVCYALARISSIILHRTGESGHLCLIPSLLGIQSFTTEYDVSCLSFLVKFIRLRIFSSITSFSRIARFDLLIFC